jgi:site-specific DNA recombinase
MELAESGKIEAVRAVKRDRLFRSRLYRLLAERDLEEYGVRLEALNDTGHRIGDGIQDDFAEWEREEITRRTLAGKLQKAREGKVIAGRLPVYGFRYTPDRNHYDVDEAKMVAVRRIFALIASGVSVSRTARTMDAEGFPPPQGGRWQRPTVREIILEDSYAPHSRDEVSGLVSPEVSGRLGDSPCGIWYYNRRETLKARTGKKVRKKPRDQWIAVPVPNAGMPLETVLSARKAIENNEKASTRSNRAWEFSGGIIRCGECGCAMIAHDSKWTYRKKDGTPSTYHRFYYHCAPYRRSGRGACAMSRTLHAKNTEEKVWGVVREAALDPKRLREALGRSRKDKRGTRDTGRLEAILARLGELERRRDGLINLAADGQIGGTELADRLTPLDAQIKALKEESDEPGLEGERAGARRENERLLLRTLETLAPEALDTLDAPERRRAYKSLGLRVVAHQDKSLIITWFMDLQIGRIGCPDEGT